VVITPALDDPLHEDGIAGGYLLEMHACSRELDHVFLFGFTEEVANESSLWCSGGASALSMNQGRSYS
jgi:hypothetical protein